MEPGGDSAYDVLLQMLKEYGLETLAPVVRGYLEQGYDQSQVNILIQDSDAYKQRFVGNDARKKAGLPVLSPKEYLSAEASYRQILSSAGMPEGFYDQPSDFAGFIGSDVSPAEIQNRVDVATQISNGLDDGRKQALRDLYGVDSKGLAAYVLDQERALPILQRQEKAVRTAGAANNQGLTLNRDRAEYLGAYVGDNPEASYAKVADATFAGKRLAEIYGFDYGQKDAEDEMILGNQDAAQKRKTLGQKETAAFSGGSGVGKSSLSQAKNY